MYGVKSIPSFIYLCFFILQKKYFSENSGKQSLMDSGVSKIILVIISSLTLLNAAGNTWQYSMWTIFLFCIK